MAFSFCAVKKFSLFFQLFTRSKIRKRDIELRIFHIHIDTDQPLLLRKLLAGLDGIVKKISQDTAEIDLRGFQFQRNMGVGND